MTGVLCRDETLPGVRPGICSSTEAPAWMSTPASARRYAAAGYVVLAGDMLGDGVAGNGDRVIGSLTTLRDDRPLMVRRVQAGLAALARCPGATDASPLSASASAAWPSSRSPGRVNPSQLRSASREPRHQQASEPGTIRARLLVCHGALDPHVPLSDVTAFAEEMNGAGADWQLIMYGGALHGFTHTRAMPGAIPGVGYDPLADTRSFAATRSFLTEIFTGGRDQPQH